MKAIHDYVLTNECIGKGQFGQVYLAYHKDNKKKLYACKVMNRDKLTTRLQQNLRNEVSVLQNIHSDHVIRLYDIQRTAHNYYLFTEYCNGGDLDNLKEIRGKFTEQEAKIILKQVVFGFQEIYKQQVMHRDLKLANILVHFPKHQFIIS